MKAIRFHFVISIFFLFLFSAFNMPLSYGKTGAGKEPEHIGMLRLFQNDAERSPVRLKDADMAGALFRTEIPLIGISVSVPSYSNNIGDLTLSLYRWEGDFETTFSSDPLVSETFVNFCDNAELTLRAEMKPGIYFWLASLPRETVGLWKSPKQIEGIESFLNGESVSDGTWIFSPLFAAEFPFRGTMEEYQVRLSLPRTSPEEPADDPALAQNDVMADTWEAVDELGRELPGNAETGKVRKGKQVGIFYWTWHNSARTAKSDRNGPYNVTKIITEHPDAVGKINHPAWGPFQAPHHWGEPVFGYYSTCDRAVLRKHAELLADAGIDAAIFDATNGTFTWMDSVIPLMETWSAARADGVRAPKVAFMLPFFSLDYTETSLRQLYRDLYKPGFHSDLWYYWDGKPLIYANPDAVIRSLSSSDEALKKEAEEILAFFTFRPGQPAYTGGPRRPDEWGWLEVYPQNGYVAKPDGGYEMMTVGAAQNHSLNPYSGKPGLHAMNDRDVFGRGHVVGDDSKPNPKSFIAGRNFSQQWSRAFEVDPDFVFVTGWNEWIAGRHEVWQELPNAFPDQYNEEFSRDCEPERGKLMDTFYMQLTANVRKFKGTRKLPAPSPSKTIQIGAGPEEWKDVGPEYRDYRGDTMARDADGYGGLHYVNTTGRNDILLCKVARDDENLYFYAETAEPLTSPSDPHWMRLFIGLPNAKDLKNWKGFSWLIEQDAEKATLLRYSGDGDEWKWTPVGEVQRHISENRLEIAVPRSLLHIGGKKTDIHFKWSDNMQNDGDILDFYENGDTAPDGRFVYRYKG